MTKVWTTLSRRPKAPEGVAVGVGQAGVNVEVVKEAAVADREPVVCLEAAAGVELAVEDLEAVEVAEVAEDNPGNILKVKT